VIKLLPYILFEKYIYIPAIGRVLRCDAIQMRRWGQSGDPVEYSWQNENITDEYKKLSYRRGTARCVVSIEILPIATQQCRNYLYDKS